MKHKIVVDKALLGKHNAKLFVHDFRTNQIRTQDPNKVVESMKLRIYNSQKGADVQISGDKENNQFVIARKLGHKSDLPGSAQWRLFDDGEEKCFYCENHIYTLVFWTLNFAIDKNNQLDPYTEEAIVKQI